MTAASRSRDQRDLVPRWRPFSPTVRLGELDPLQPASPRKFEADPEPEHAFEADPGIFTAGDLLSHALARGIDTKAVQLAADLVNEGRASFAAEILADHALHGPPTPDDAESAARPLDEDSARLRAADMRRIVRIQPRNAVRWADLALSHVNLGHLRRAEAEMSVALKLAPQNRFVLRSAARLFMLLGEPDRALQTLQRSDALDVDPWLQSAEISVAEVAERPSVVLRRARRDIDRTIWSPWHISELAAEIATAEMRSGSTRRARKLMTLSLVQPTENTVAQAEWASHVGLSTQHDEALALPRSFEARTLDFAERGQYRESVAEGLKWQADQPFDVEAATHVSYLAAVMLEQYALAASAASRGLVANPDHALLRNNLVFSLASQGNVAQARHEFSLIDTSALAPGALATLEATRGLLEFRGGQAEQGRESYKSAISQFAKLGMTDNAALARLFLAREELLANSTVAQSALRGAISALQGSQVTGARLLIERLMDAVDQFMAERYRRRGS